MKLYCRFIFVTGFRILILSHALSAAKAAVDANDVGSTPAALVEKTQSSLDLARKHALDALRRGDVVTANNDISEIVLARGDSASTAGGAAEELAALCFTLADTGARSQVRDVTSGVVRALKLLESGQAPEASLRAGLLGARLEERVLRNPDAARDAYRRVLQHFPDNRPAKEGLARINLAKAVAAEKMQEQRRIQQANAK